MLATLCGGTAQRHESSPLGLLCLKTSLRRRDKEFWEMVGPTREFEKGEGFGEVQGFRGIDGGERLGRPVVGGSTTVKKKK